jgi:putative ABC transport system ATP-binding protein
MLQLKAVSKDYRKNRASVVALRPTTFDICRGEYVAIIGPSGSGKSTLLSILGGMLSPTNGEVWLDGVSLYRLAVRVRTELRRQKIGFVFQTFNLVPYLTALENVTVPLYLAGVKPREQRTRGLALLERVGLGDRVDHKPAELSIGQQQRVALARTMANDPALILADEPTGNLVMVTHDPVVSGQADKVLRLVAGTVVAGEAGQQAAPAA